MTELSTPHLREIYGEEAERQLLRYQNAVDAFRRAFHTEPADIFRAPGRTELCGNHTDHQGGQVLAAAIDDDAIAVAAPTEDGRIILISEGFGTDNISLDSLAPDPAETGTSAALIRGVAAGCIKHGIPVTGARIFSTSEVQVGSGMSSSAAFENLLGAVFAGLCSDSLALDAVTIAKIGQTAENIYFGKPSGLMDQLSSAVGNLVHIDFYEPDPQVERLSPAFLSDDYSICLTNCHSSHADLTDEYAAIPREMKQVAAVLGKNLLGRTTTEELLRAIPALREACGDRAILRALHYAEENRRVEACVNALKKDDAAEFLRAFRESANSSARFLQNVSSQKDPMHQSLMLGIAVSEQFLNDMEAVRVHGGGFAGTIQTLVLKDRAGEYAALMDSVFGLGSCRAHTISRFGAIRVF